MKKAIENAVSYLEAQGVLGGDIVDELKAARLLLEELDEMLVQVNADLSCSAGRLSVIHNLKTETNVLLVARDNVRAWRRKARRLDTHGLE